MKVYLTICIMIFVLIAGLDAQIVTNGLISYYTLDADDIDGKTVKDMFGENHGTIVGDPQSIPGHMAEGLDFGGQPDCVELPQIMAIGENSVTYETWFMKTNNAGWQYLMTNKNDFHNNFFRLGLNENTGQVRFYTEHDDELNTKFVTATDYGDGEWHHVVATRDGDQAKIYVDGALAGEGDAMDGNIGGDDTNWYLAQDGNTNGYLIGAMDEVRIYSRALTEEEVKQNFESEGGTAVNSRSKLITSWAMIKKSLYE